MIEILSQVIYQVGAGGALGFIVGYSVKKVGKILAVVAGIFTIILLLLEYQGVINVNYDKFLQMVESLTGSLGQSIGWISPILAHLPFAGSFAVGAVIGLKVG